MLTTAEKGLAKTRNLFNALSSLYCSRKSYASCAVDCRSNLSFVYLMEKRPHFTYHQARAIIYQCVIGGQTFESHCLPEKSKLIVTCIRFFIYEDEPDYVIGQTFEPHCLLKRSKSIVTCIWLAIYEGEPDHMYLVHDMFEFFSFIRYNKCCSNNIAK